MISLFYGILEELCLAVGPVGLYDPGNFINFAVDAADVNEIGELAVDKISVDPERLRHVIYCH
jgi:hypothetical protein